MARVTSQRLAARCMTRNGRKVRSRGVAADVPTNQQINGSGSGATQQYKEEEEEEDEAPALVHVIGGVQQLDNPSYLSTIEGGTLTIGRGDVDLDHDRPLQASPGQPGQAAQLTHQRHAIVVLRGGAYFLGVQGVTMMTRINDIPYTAKLARQAVRPARDPACARRLD